MELFSCHAQENYECEKFIIQDKSSECEFPESGIIIKIQIGVSEKMMNTLIGANSEIVFVYLSDSACNMSEITYKDRISERVQNEANKTDLRLIEYCAEHKKTTR